MSLKIDSVQAKKDESLAISLVPRVTVEVVLWAFVVVVALVLRLVNLDAAPLNVREAREAMLAWRAVTGQGMPDTDYSPLLLVANAFLFMLFGASDVLARLVSALFGSVLALAPHLFRRRIGRVGALAAGLYLAISPMAVFASRQLDGVAIVTLGGAVLLGGVVRFFDTGKRFWLTLSAVGLALAIVAVSSAWGMLLALGLAWLSLAWFWPGVRVQWLSKSMRPHLGYALAVFVLAASVLSTGLGWNMAGIGAVGDLLPVWLSQVGGKPTLLPLGLLGLYEPLLVFFSLGGLAWALRHHRCLGAFLGLWAGLGLLVLVLVPGRAPADGVWIVLPLALLSGIALEVLVRNARGFRDWRGLGLYASITFALWVYFYLRIMRYALYGDLNDLLLGVIAFIFPLLLLFFAALFFMLTSGLEDREVFREIVLGIKAVLRGAAVGTCVVLLVTTISAGWGCAQVRPADPREWLVYEPTALEVRDLVQTLCDISAREMGIPTVLEFVYEAPPDSVLSWYLRDFSSARRVDDLQSLDDEEIGSIVVTARRDWAAADTEGFVGQDFALQRSWDARGIGCYWEQVPSTSRVKWPPQCNLLLRWLVLRQTPGSPQAVGWAVMWVRSTEFSHSH